MNNPIHVAFYFRSATGNLVDLRRQQKAVEREFVRRGFDFTNCLVTSYTDTHQSGMNNGPELSRLLNDVTGKKIQVVMVSRMNRISRRLAGLSAFYSIIAEHRFRFISENENIDSVNWQQIVRGGK